MSCPTHKRKGCRRHHAVCSPYCFYGRRDFLHAWHRQAYFPSPKGANVNNRGWNDRRSWNLRIADTHSPIVPKGGEQEQDWVWFAPFGDAPSLPVPNPQVPFPSVIPPAVIESWPPLGTGGCLWELVGEYLLRGLSGIWKARKRR